MPQSNPLLSLASLAARLLPMRVKRLLYRSPRLSHWIRGGLNRAAPQGLSEVSVAAGGLAGMRLMLDLHSEKDYWLGTYEPDLQAAVAELVRPGSVAYDLGANIGYISLLLARAVGKDGHVYAFEALPTNLERLRVNLALNGLDSTVTVVPAAVADASAPLQFLVGPSGGTGKAQGSAGRQELGYSQAMTVDGICLDDFVYQQGNPAPQAVKIDIEGGEVLALPGMRRILAERHPLLLLELHGPEAARVAWELLSACGYQICRMAAGYPGVPSLDALDWKAYLVGLPVD
jgi:FkbM family methyltransferase